MTRIYTSFALSPFTTDKTRARIALAINTILIVMAIGATTSLALGVTVIPTPLTVICTRVALLAVSLLLLHILKCGYIWLVTVAAAAAMSAAIFVENLSWATVGMVGLVGFVALGLIAFAALVIGLRGMLLVAAMHVGLTWLSQLSRSGLQHGLASRFGLIHDVPVYGLSLAAAVVCVWMVGWAKLRRGQKQRDSGVGACRPGVTELRLAMNELQQLVIERTQEVYELSALRSREASQRKRAEAALRNLQGRTARVLENTPDCFYALDSQLRFTYVNPQTEAHFGLRKEDLLRHAYTDVLPDTQSHDVPCKFREALSQRKTIHLNFKSPSSGKWGEMSIYPANDGSEVLVSFRDVTERKLAEEALRASDRQLNLALDASAAGTWSWDVATNVSTWDDRFHELYGYAPDTPRTFETWFNSVLPIDRLDALKHIQSLVEENASADVSWREAFRAWHPDKGERWMLNLGSAVRDTSGKVVSLVGLNLDITERRLAQEAMQRAHSELEAREARLQERTAQLAAANIALQAEVDERRQAEEALRQRLEFEALVASISAKFMSLPPERFDEGLEFVLETMGEFTQVDLCRYLQVIEALDPAHGPVIKRTHEWLSPARNVLAHISDIDIISPLNADDGWWVNQWSSLGYVQINSESALPPNIAYARNTMRRLGMKSVLMVPVVHHGAVAAILALVSLQQERTWTSEKIGQLRLVAATISAAWERRQQAVALQAERDRLEQRVAERSRELSRLFEVTQTITSTLHLQPLLKVILEQLQEVVHSADVGISEITEDGTEKLMSAIGCTPSDQIIHEWPGAAEDSHLHALLTSHKPVIVADFQADEPLAHAFRARTQHTMGHLPAIGSLMRVPLMVRERMIGVMHMVHPQPNFYTPLHAELAMTFANQAAIAIENARLLTQEKQAAATAERSRLARELHDSVSQALFGIVLGARTVVTMASQSSYVESQSLTNPLDYLLSLSETALVELRALILELRPEAIQQVGLVAALRRQAEMLTLRQHIHTLTDFMPSEPDVDLAVKEALFRIGIEALQNTVKHAQATQVNLTLQSCPEGLMLEVRDNGRGFDLSEDHPGHFGLHSMRERAEQSGLKLCFESRPNHGTRVRVIFASSPSECLS